MKLRQNILKIKRKLDKTLGFSLKERISTDKFLKDKKVYNHVNLESY